LDEYKLRAMLVKSRIGTRRRPEVMKMDER
jgi:hypothetical protein